VHKEAYDFVARVVKNYGPFERALEIGSYDVNGSIRPLFSGASTYVGIDVRPGPGVDVVASGATYQPSFEPDCVVCCEVLEHTIDWQRICANAAKILPLGGVFIMTCASLGRPKHSIDGVESRSPEYYRNLAKSEIEQVFERIGMGMAVCKVNAMAHDLYAVGFMRGKYRSNGR
jgi:hypothetical protein